MKYLLYSFFTFVVYSVVSVASASVIEGKACTMEYAPVCAKVQVQCFRAPCYAIYTTYSNQCMMSAETQATLVHTEACTTYEEGKPAVLSEKLKSSIKLQYDKYLIKVFLLDINEQLSKLSALDSRIKTRIDLYKSDASVGLQQEMKTDWFRNAYSYLEDLNLTNIYKAQEQITGKRYLFRDTLKCEGVKFKCMDGESAFFDDIGCGCKK